MRGEGSTRRRLQLRKARSRGWASQACGSESHCYAASLRSGANQAPGLPWWRRFPCRLRSKGEELTMRKDKPMAPARLLIADDHDLMREATRSMLEGAPDLEVVGEAVNGRHALELCRQMRPDLVLMDVRMPEMDGLTATRAIKEELPAISVLLLTVYESDDYRREGARAGAAGYVQKDASGQQLREAVRNALGRGGE